MREKEFSTWLAEEYRTDAGSTMDPATRGSRISNCRRVEQYLGDLDRAYDVDRMDSLLAKLELRRIDTIPRHDIPIDGDLYNGTATLKSAARLYQKFRASTTPSRPNASVIRRSRELEQLDAQLRISLPDDARRKQAAELMGRLIEKAARTMPAGWALSWRRNRGIFLTLTFYRVFAVDRNRILLAFTTSDAPSALKSEVERARVAYGKVRVGGGYVSMEDTTSAYVPTSFYFERREELDPLIEQFAVRIAQKYTSTAFSRFHAPVAVEWLEEQIGRDLPSPAYEVRPDQRAGELAQLVDEFEMWCATETGRNHLHSYPVSRASAVKNLEGIRAARDAAEEITDRVLLGVLPHLDTPTNRAREAWISIASAVAGDIRTKLRRTDDEWRRIASRILEFMEAALADPASLAEACESFARSPESPDFQSGMLTPFLNAIAPQHFAILNKKSRLATRYITGARFGQSLTDYPSANEMIRATAAQLADAIDEAELDDVPDGDLYDAFSHWLVSERRFFQDADEDEPREQQRDVGQAEDVIEDPPAASSLVAPSYSLDELAEDTGISVQTAATWVRAINRKGQAIFYGPPGTGKTYVSEKLARHLAGGGDGFTETLQFHPAYSYEDFMEGMRPQSDGNVLTYPVVPGRFRSFCERAARRTGICVLVIDEINRANLGRVLGELMYLLEYREASVPLASGTSFTIPANVRIIGTMNTADRSIALVDHALRRRFAFIRLEPDYDVLRRRHNQSPLSVALAALLEKINKSIDPHYHIGISFFMGESLELHLADIWRMEIEPYLEEYFFDDAEKCMALRWHRVAEQLRLSIPEVPSNTEPQPSATPLPERRD